MCSVKGLGYLIVGNILQQADDLLQGPDVIRDISLHPGVTLKVWWIRAKL